MAKKMVAYFSASGVTAKVADMLADAIGADIHEICPKIPYNFCPFRFVISMLTTIE